MTKSIDLPRGHGEPHESAPNKIAPAVYRTVSRASGAAFP
jgi:hypothetical protein